VASPVCFPAPLPYETLYSFLCRYHVRSCNASDYATIRQLFDQKRSLHTTVLSPFPLRFAGEWTNSFQGFTRDSLIREHTAFPFYQAFHPCANASRSSYAADRFFMAMYNRCATPSKKLRYCPKCAQLQWESFGVSYWQILPQINGYEICPIHMEPIRETDISHRDIRYSFFPASNILGKIKPSDDTDHIHWVDLYQSEFLQMAEDINYLFQYSYTGFHLGSKIQKTLQFDLMPVHHNWKKTILTDPVLMECGHDIDEDLLYALIDDSGALISQINCLPVYLQLRICRAMFGDIEEFCTKLL